MTSSSSTRTTATRATRRADKLGGIPADAPLDLLGRLISDGSTLPADYSFDGDDVQPGRPRRGHRRLGGPADRPGRAVRPGADLPGRALRLDPLQPGPSGGGGGGGGGGTDRRRRLRRHDARRRLGRRAPRPGPDGQRRRAAHPGRSRATSTARRNNAKNLVMRDAPAGAWTATAKINFEGSAQYHQAGIMRLRRRRQLHEVRPHRPTRGSALTRSSSSSTRTRARRATTRADSTANLAGGLPGRLLGPDHVRRDATSPASTRPTGPTGPTSAARRRCRRTPRSACSRSATTATGNPVAAFDSFTLTTGRRRRPAGPSFDDEFDGATPRQGPLERDRARHAGRVRGVPGASSRSPPSPATSTRATRTRRRTTSSSRTRRTPARTG